MAKDAVVGTEKEKDKGENLKSPPAMEKDTHKESGLTSKFYGDSDGNKDRPSDISGPKGGGAGESHPFSAKSPFIGETKGNKDRPVDVSRGTGGKDGGKYVAGRGNKVFSGNKGGF